SPLATLSPATIFHCTGKVASGESSLFPDKPERSTTGSTSSRRVAWGGRASRMIFRAAASVTRGWPCPSKNSVWIPKVLALVKRFIRHGLCTRQVGYVAKLSKHRKEIEDINAPSRQAFPWNQRPASGFLYKSGAPPSCKRAFVSMSVAASP